MSTYNVSTTVVELVEADSPDQAVDKLNAAVRRAGFEVYDGAPGDAFESEPLPEGTEVLR